MYGVLPQTMTKKSAQFDDNHDRVYFLLFCPSNFRTFYTNTVSVDITQATTVTKD